MLRNLEVGPRIASDDDFGSIEATAVESELARLRRSTAPVLTRGNTGSGKGHYARLIAQESALANTLVHVNCAALPSNLIEAELFGHEKGAFTDADADAAKKGLIETADGSTLFLGEIGEVAQTLKSEGSSRIDYRQLPDAMNQFLKNRADGQVRRPFDPTRAPVREGTAKSAILPKKREILLKSELVAALNACDGNVSELAR
ncbi:MAG: transcriptional regulator of acetoin/glycerol metabolism [Flavobacteriales bacterium]